MTFRPLIDQYTETMQSWLLPIEMKSNSKLEALFDTQTYKKHSVKKHSEETLMTAFSAALTQTVQQTLVLSSSWTSGRKNPRPAEQWLLQYLVQLVIM